MVLMKIIKTFKGITDSQRLLDSNQFLEMLKGKKNLF